MFKKREKKTTIISLRDGMEDEDDEQGNIVNTSSSTKQSALLGKKRLDNQEDISSTKSLLEDLRYKSSYTLSNTNDATRECEVNTEKDKDAMSRLERNKQISRDKLSGKISEDTYMGQSASIIYAEKSERDLSRYKVTGSLGPMRAPTNVRLTCRFDYAPGICKDYKETGYCGFGDGCVFMHDRGDYKTGWELEEEWRRKQKEKERAITEGRKCTSDSDSDCHTSEDESNSLCKICQNELSNPVSTVCQHYFCEKCALEHYSKNSTCFTCNKPTQGIFNNADKLIRKLKDIKHKKCIVVNKKNFRDDKTALSDEEEENGDNIESIQTKEKNYNFSLDLDENEDEVGFSKNVGKVKNTNSKNNSKKKFKSQNDWIYASNYNSYD